MTLILCVEVERQNNKPLFQVSVYDIDNPVNYHSYECYFFEKCTTLEQFYKIKEKAKRFITEYKKD